MEKGLATLEGVFWVCLVCAEEVDLFGKCSEWDDSVVPSFYVLEWLCTASGLDGH